MRGRGGAGGRLTDGCVATVEEEMSAMVHADSSSAIHERHTHERGVASIANMKGGWIGNAAQ